MADPFLERVLRRAPSTAKQVAPAVAPKAPPAPQQVQPITPPALEETKRTEPSAEGVTPPAPPATPKMELKPELREELPLKDFYETAARFGFTNEAVGAFARQKALDKKKFEDTAAIQGVSLDDMAKNARAGKPFEEYRATRKDVLGFKPVAEREAETRELLEDFESARAGKAPKRPIALEGEKGVETTKETTTFVPWLGEGYEVGGTTADEVPETSKPGEYAYAIAQELIKKLDERPEVAVLVDQYASNQGAGASQRYINDRVKQEIKNRNITPSTPDADALVAGIRQEALYELMARKTIGQWTPGIFIKDVQATDPLAKPLGAEEGFGATTRDIFASLSPNVEIVGMNNKRQAVLRQESPGGVVLRTLDFIGVSPISIKGVKVPIPGQSLLAGLMTRGENEGKWEAALRGAQTGASFVDVALDATKDWSTAARVPVGLAGLGLSIVYPDVTDAAGASFKAAKKFTQDIADNKIRKAAVPILDEYVRALKDENYPAAQTALEKLRNDPALGTKGHGVVQAVLRADAAAIQALTAMDPELASLNRYLADDLVSAGARQNPELAELVYQQAVVGYPFLHFSTAAPELARKGDEGAAEETFKAYVDAGNYQSHFDKIKLARADFLRIAPKTYAEAQARMVDDTVKHLRKRAEDARVMGASSAAKGMHPDERLADIIEANRAELFKNPARWMADGGPLRTALKADPVIGTDAMSKFREDFYGKLGATMQARAKKLADAGEAGFDELYKKDLRVFDRAEEAVRANIKSAMMGAEFVKRELADAAKIRVTPIDIVDELMGKGTDRLSPFALAAFMSTMRELPANQDRAAWLAAFQTVDANLRGASVVQGKSVEDMWRDLIIRIEAGEAPSIAPKGYTGPPVNPDLGGLVGRGVAPGPAFRPPAVADVADVNDARSAIVTALNDRNPDHVRVVTRADGTGGGVEVVYGDVAIKVFSKEDGKPFTASARVGTGRAQIGGRKGFSTATDAFEAALTKAQDMMDARVKAGEPAVKGAPPAPAAKAAAPAPAVKAAAPPTAAPAPVPTAAPAPAPALTPAARAAAEPPEILAAEEKAIDKVAATAPSEPPKLHPDTEDILRGLDADLGAKPEVVSSILAQVDRLKAGSKMPPPPKGATKVLMGAVRDELLKSGKLVKLEDGTIVRAGGEAAEEAPAAAKVEAPAAAPALTPAPTPTPTTDLVDTWRNTTAADVVTVGGLVRSFKAAPGVGSVKVLPESSIVVVERGGRYYGFPSQKDFELVEADFDSTLAPVRFSEVRGVVRPAEYSAGGELIRRGLVDIDGVPRKAGEGPAPEAPAAPPVAAKVEAPAPVVEAPKAEPVVEAQPSPDARMQALMAVTPGMGERERRAADALRKAERKLTEAQDLRRASEQFATREDVRGSARLRQQAAEAEFDAAVNERLAAEAEAKAEPVVEAPVFERAVEAELPVARKAKGFSDKNSLDAGVYEVEVGGQTRRFFRDTKEGPFGAAWVEDVRGDAGMPITFLGNTKDDAIKALQRKYAEEAAPAMRAAEEAPAAAPEAVKAEEAAAPAQPTGITPTAEAPVVREEIVAPPAPTEAELRQTIANLEPLKGKLRRTNIKPDSFEVKVGDQTVVAKKTADGWVDPSRIIDGKPAWLGNNATDATGSIEAAYVLTPLTRAEAALRELTGGPVVPELNTLRGLARNVRGYKAADGLFRDILAEGLDDAAKTAALQDLQARVRALKPTQNIEDLLEKIQESLDNLRPKSAAEEAAKLGPMTDNHTVAVESIRTLTHRADFVAKGGKAFTLYGGMQGDRFVPVMVVRADAPLDEVREALYDQARMSEAALSKQRADYEQAVAATPVTNVRPFPGSKYANDIDLKYNPKSLPQVVPTPEGGRVAGRFTPSPAPGGQHVITLFAQTANPTTLLHESAHYIRRAVLDQTDMDNITGWIRSQGVNVEHKFGEFIGTPADIERAEEMFAVAFEKYVVTGKAPTPALKVAFETVRHAFAKTYQWIKGNAEKEVYGGVDLDPRVVAVFDRYFTAVPKEKPASLLEVMVRETKGAKPAESKGALDVLADEAKRVGVKMLLDSSGAPIAKSVTTAEGLSAHLSGLKLPENTDPNMVVLSFEGPVLGKKDWTFADVQALQTRVTMRRNEFGTSDLRMAMFGAPEEETVSEAIYSYFEPRAEGAEGRAASLARAAGGAMAKTILGGNIVAERGTRMLPPALRRSIDTTARILEQATGDTISVLMEATDEGKPQFLYDFLAGENLRYSAGRRVISSGNEFIDGYLQLYRNQVEALSEDERALLQEFAQALNTLPDAERARLPQTPSEALKAMLFPRSLSDVDSMNDLRQQVQAKANRMAAAIEKFRSLGGSGDGTVGSQLAKALANAAGEGSQPSFNEFRFAELMLYLSGTTARNGKFFADVDGTYSKDMLKYAAKTLLEGGQKIYANNATFSRQLAVLVGAYGSTKRAKAELAELGAVLTAEQAHALNAWTLGYYVEPDMRAQLDLLKGKFGLNTQFTMETVLGANVYIPKQARERIVEALGKAQFNGARLTKPGDAYQALWTFMKKRMTRGAMLMRQRYFIVNTVDHFNQMALITGYGPALASFTRIAAQTLITNVLGQAGEAFVRLANRLGAGGVLPKSAIETFRGMLQAGGDRASRQVQRALGLSKYSINTNAILEGRNVPIILGGNVYTAKQLREMMVAEGVFSSFDTRRLSEGIRMEGNIFSNDLKKLATAGEVKGTTANAAAKVWGATTELLGAGADVVTDVTFRTVDDLADAWAERERLGAVMTLMEIGFEPRVACRLTTDALYDYSQSMTKGDRHFLLGAVMPFWAFQKNANQQFVNVLFSPRGAYRMMALVRAREGSAQLLQGIYYGHVGGELGIDVDSMPQDMQDLYYAIMTRAHEVYGDTLPDDVRVGLRMIMTGRADEVINGKYYELDAELIRIMKSGGLLQGAAFGNYMLPLPGKAGLPSYVRDRFGAVLPQRRNAITQHYNALMGKNDDVLFVMLPESSVESAFKHITSVMATGNLITSLTANAFGVTGLPGVDIVAGGAGAMGPQDVLQALSPVIDLERSPLVGVGISMYAERGYPQRLHPHVASMLQSLVNMPVLRVPGVKDPFQGGTLQATSEEFELRQRLAEPEQPMVGQVDANGEPIDIVDMLGADYVRQVQQLNASDIPADVLAEAKGDRFYLPPGVISLAFENSPLGEINKELLRAETRPRERADALGRVAEILRKYASGVDVIEVSPSKTAQQEEPVRYVETRKPF